MCNSRDIEIRQWQFNFKGLLHSFQNLMNVKNLNSLVKANFKNVNKEKYSNIRLES